MGLEGGSAVANSVPDCLSFVQGPGTVLGNLSRRRGRAATLNFWRGVPWGKAAIADFLAENLPRGEGSYRQFLGRRALEEGGYRRFFGREFEEPAACEGRLAKGSKVWKSRENPSKKMPKLVKKYTLEAPGSLPGST